MKVKLEFIEPVLGTLAGDPKIAEEFIASKHPESLQEDEQKAIDNLDETIEKASTVFPRDDNRPFIWDYQFKGFFKTACLAMIETDTLTKVELKAVRLTPYLYKRTIDTQIFVAPRRVFLELPKGCNSNKLNFCERPLRGQTQRGERIALARSEEAPEGTKVEFEIIVMNPKIEPFIKRWLDFGRLYGMLQWRNSGKGRFSWKELQ